MKTHHLSIKQQHFAMGFQGLPPAPCAQDVWFLSPGIGAQGGDLAAALEAGLRSDGLGILLPISRGHLGSPGAG